MKTKFKYYRFWKHILKCTTSISSLKSFMYKMCLLSTYYEKNEKNVIHSKVLVYVFLSRNKYVRK